MNLNVPINVETRVVVKYLDTGEILVDKSNAIHAQNMARIISRALANEPNSIINRMAFGNGGTFISATGEITHNPPNDGSDGSWQSRLYNEQYSEIINEDDISFGRDLGSSDANVTRPGGADSASDDPTGGGVVSQEVGLKSNIIINVVLNENEPSGQAESSTDPITESESCFLFDEIGLYSPGKPAKSTNGYTTVNVGNKTSDDYINLSASTSYTFKVRIDGILYTTGITTPSSGSGSNGELTYGDLCEGLNTGTWITSGDSISARLFTYITDSNAGTYPSINARQSYGYLTFQSKTSGSLSRVEVICTANLSTDLMNAITNNTCANCNIVSVNGENAGVQNDPIHPENERERLLTHFICDPILKSKDRKIGIEYTLTFSVAYTKDSTLEVLNNN